MRDMHPLPLPVYDPPTAVSPFAQKPFAGMLNGYIFWGFRRIAQQVPYFILPFGFGYAVYTWGNTKWVLESGAGGDAATGAGAMLAPSTCSLAQTPLGWTLTDSLRYAYYNSKEGHHAIHEAEHGH
jgi:hypothetical protein